jgi:hypothetical protein
MAAAMAGLFAPRSSTRLPVHQAKVLPQHVGDLVDARRQFGVGEGFVLAVDGDAIAVAARERSVDAASPRSSGAGDTAVRAGRNGSRATVRAAANARARNCPA